MTWWRGGKGRRRRLRVRERVGWMVYVIGTLRLVRAEVCDD